jgi:hypothetical protein
MPAASKVSCVDGTESAGTDYYKVHFLVPESDIGLPNCRHGKAAQQLVAHGITLSDLLTPLDFTSNSGFARPITSMNSVQR